MVIKKICWWLSGPSVLPVKQRFSQSKVRWIGIVRNNSGIPWITLASYSSYKVTRGATRGFAHYTQNTDTHHHAIPTPAGDGRIYCPTALELDKTKRRGRREEGKKKKDMACATSGRKSLRKACGNAFLPMEMLWEGKRSAPREKGASYSLCTQTRLQPWNTSAIPPPNRISMKSLPFS